MPVTWIEGRPRCGSPRRSRSRVDPAEVEHGRRVPRRRLLPVDEGAEVRERRGDREGSGLRSERVIGRTVIPCAVRDFSYAVLLPEEKTQVFLGPLAEVPLEVVAETGCLVLDDRIDAARARALGDFAARLVRRPPSPSSSPAAKT